MKLVIDCRVIAVGYHNGLSRFTSRLMTALYELTPFTAVIYDTRQLEHLPKGIDYIIGPKYSVSSQRTLTKILNDSGADIVFAPTVFFTLGKRKFKLISSLHDTNGFDVKDPFGHEEKLHHKLLWRAYHSTKTPQRATLETSDHIVTVSEASKQAILDYKLTKRPISVIYNAPFDVTPVHYQPDSKRLVYMGTFYTYKNVSTLIKAINLMPDYTLILLGRIRPRTRAALEKIITNPKQVVFKNGVTDQEYHEELSRAAALVNASKFEGFGLPLVEAQAAGVPVVCSDIPVFHEVCAGESALFFNPSNPKELVARVGELPEKHIALIAAGKRNAARFTWQQSAQDLYDIITQYIKT